MRGPIELALGTKRYKILFDKAAIYAFEEENLKRLGRERGFFQMVADVGRVVERAAGKSIDGEARGPSFTEVALALWAATRTHHPNLPLEKLRGELEVVDYGRYINLILEALVAALPEQLAGEEPAVAEPGVPFLGPTPSSGG